MAPNRRPPAITCTATIGYYAQPDPKTAAVWHWPPVPARRKMPPQSLKEARLAESYDVTILTVRPGTHPQALTVLGQNAANDASLLACWYSDIGAVNQILLIRKATDAGLTLDARFATLNASNPFG